MMHGDTIKMRRNHYRAATDATDRWNVASEARDAAAVAIACYVVGNVPPRPEDVYCFRLFDRMANAHADAWRRRTVTPAV